MRYSWGTPSFLATAVGILISASAGSSGNPWGGGLSRQRPAADVFRAASTYSFQSQVSHFFPASGAAAAFLRYTRALTQQTKVPLWDLGRGGFRG
ncbi:MAG: hypothetical protein Q4D16_21955 [Eubacteriales bacterium]|nr:hypothetical protein [Eubacteriales bacterium]